MPTYFLVEYDNEASGPFVAEGANLTWTASSAFIITVVDRGSTGKLYCALLSGSLPANDDALAQGTVTADANGAAVEIAYPAFFRKDVAVASNGTISWTGPALGATHSFKFDAQTANVVPGEILTFLGGQTCEVITVVSDAGASGELDVRFNSSLDEGLPADNDTFTGDIAGDGTVDGAIHDRCYKPLHLHRMLQNLNDDEDIAGDDDLSRVDPTPSNRSTDQIIALLGAVNISDTVAQHMYGGSLSQAGGDILYSGLDVQVTSPTATTQPILIQDDAIITDYWKDGYMPDSIAGNVRIMRKTREDGVDFDGKRVKGKLAEFGDSYFIGGTTLGEATTALALFASNDGNNNTAVGTVAGAPYNTIVMTEGYQTLDYNNGNGATAFGLSIDYGSASNLQTYERTKYIGRRGTAENIHGRSALYFDGVNLDFAFDGGSGAFTEDEKVVWGTVMAYNAQTTNLTLGEVVTFSGGSRGRLLYMDDTGVSGTLIFDMDGNALPLTTETMTGVSSGGDGTLTSVGTNTAAGTGTLVAATGTTTGSLYISRRTGVSPVNNSEIYGATSNQDCLVNGVPNTRTVNNQFVGVFTGSNFQTNFGIGIDPSDSPVNDQNVNLLGVTQGPPDNQYGSVTDIKEGDTVTCYPWDGATLDANGDAEPTFAEATLAVGLTAGVSTIVDVGTGNIPENTPAAGFLRIERDSDGNYDLVEYASHDGDDEYTLVGTAPSTAAIANNVMRALIDAEATAADQSAGYLRYQAIKGTGTTQTAVTVKNGYTALKNGPIQVFKTNPIFGASGFQVGAVRNSDA